MSTSLFELVAGVLGVPADQLTLESGPKNLPQWDSLAHVTIAAAVEQTFGVELTMPEILAVRSLGDLQTALQKRGKGVTTADATG